MLPQLNLIMSIDNLLNHYIDCNNITDDFSVEPIYNNSSLFNHFDYHITNINKPLKYDTGFIFYHSSCFDVGMGICDFSQIDYLSMFMDTTQLNVINLMNYIKSIENLVELKKNDFIKDNPSKYKLVSIINKANTDYLNKKIINLNGCASVKNYANITNFVNLINCPGISILSDSDLNNKSKKYGFGKISHDDTEKYVQSNYVELELPQVLEHIKLNFKTDDFYYKYGKKIYGKNAQTISRTIRDIKMSNTDLNDEQIDEKINNLIYKFEFYKDKKISLEIVKMSDIEIRKEFIFKIIYRKQPNIYIGLDISELKEPNSCDNDELMKYWGNPVEKYVKNFSQLKNYLKPNCYISVKFNIDKIFVEKSNNNITDLNFGIIPQIFELNIIQLADNFLNPFVKPIDTKYHIKPDDKDKINDITSSINEYIEQINKSNKSWIKYEIEDDYYSNSESDLESDFDFESDSKLDLEL